MSVLSSTAHTGEGASAASTLPVAMVPIRMPEPFKKLRRASGRSSFGTSPGASSQRLDGSANWVIGAWIGMMRMLL